MKKLLSLLLTLSLCGFAAAAESKSDVQKRLDNAATVLQEITAAPDKGIPEDVLNGAKCVAIVPHMVKAGFGIGGQHGKGVATCKNTQGWSAPSFFTISGGSFGLQIGAEGVDLVMLVMNEKGMQALLSDKFQIGGDASAAAGPVGRDAGASTNWKLQSELLTWSRSKGLFAGVDLNGVSVTQNTADTMTLYGAPHSFRSILDGNVPVPAAAEPFVRTVAKYFHEAKENTESH